MNSNRGTVTFLFTDLENSTPLWENHPALMPALAARHDALLGAVIEAQGGLVVKTTGDGFHAVFDSASDAVTAAVVGQQALLAESWPEETGPLRVRMGLHTGESRRRAGDYYGAEVNRAARVMGIAHGGQVLVSGTTATLIRTSLPAGVSLLDLGEHRLRGLTLPEQIFQVCHPAIPSEFPPLKSISTYKHNLPVQLSSFVGREAEVAAVPRLLQEHRLVTLLGPGGTGKTRLMLACAEAVLDDFADGVWLVELATLSEPDLIPERVAAVLNVPEQPGRAMATSLVDFLRHKELLLLLDNVEHLVRESAELAEFLLTHCPGLKILVTGREALFIRGELTLQIASLSLPTGRGDPALAEILASEAVQLFITRAQEFRPDFELTAANAPAIIEIVRRLDGIPLALELATARLRILSVDAIAERLNDRFRLLTGGRRTALPRQQTLQALIDWSWNLLDEPERLLMSRLSVFAGGWSLEAAQAVTTDDRLDEYDVLDLLEQLANKSLVAVSYPSEGVARYGFLESIRQYGQERLFESGAGSLIRDRHAAYCVSFAEAAWPHLSLASMFQWIERITLELDNLRTALAWTQTDHPDLALRIAGNLLCYEAHWLSLREAQSWLQSAIEGTRSLLASNDSRVQPVVFIKALIGLATTHALLGRTAQSLPIFDESIQLARSVGASRHLAYAIAIKYLQLLYNMTPAGMAELEQAVAICRANSFDTELMWTLGVYCQALITQGRREAAIPLLAEVMEITRRTENPRDADLLAIQASMLLRPDDLAEVRGMLLPAIANFQRLKHRRGVVMGQSAMAHLLRRHGENDEAVSYYRQTIIAWQEMGQLPAVAHQLECLAYIAIEQAEYEHAAYLLGAAGSARRNLNAISEDPQEIQEMALALEQLADALGESERDRLMAAGGLMSIEDAVRLALGGSARR